MKDIVVDFESRVDGIDKFLGHTSGKPQIEKKDELLIDHMNLTMDYFDRLCIDKGIDVIVRRIIDRLTVEGSPLEQEYKELVYSLFVNAVYLHDAGKINPSYQVNVLKNKLLKWKKGLPDKHSKYSALIYIDVFTDEIESIQEESVKIYIFNILYSFAYLISKHHGNLDGVENFLNELATAKEEAQRGVLAYYKNGSVYEMNFTNNPFRVRENIYKDLNLVAPEFYILNRLLFSVIVTCDYYATYQYMCGSTVDMSYIENAAARAENYYNSELYKDIRAAERDVFSCQVETLSMNGLRTRIFLEAEKGLLNNLDKNIFYLEAPTGSGKTNTSVNLMLKLLENDKSLRNVFYVFPFNTLAEQTASSLKDYFSKDDAVVVNSVTPIITDEKKGGDDSIVDFDSSYLNRLFFHYPLAITSHINLFNALFGTSRENAYILPRLCGSVIIMDEIQCYKNKIWREIVIMLQKYAELLNIKIIIMSATLPRLDYMLGENVPGFAPLLSDSSLFYENKAFKYRVVLKNDLLAYGKIDIDALADAVVSKYMQRRKKCLIEFIKKSTARKFFNTLRDKLAEAGCEDCCMIELSGDDNIFTRKAAISKIKNLTNVIVVATQVIEAGVDIDMDYGFKNISIVDSEEQFLGRINRSCLKQGCTVGFFMLDEPEEIYRGDKRINFTLKNPEMLGYLISKDFKGYYSKVMDILMETTSKQNTQNIASFITMLLTLEYKKVNEHMRLIDNRTVQLFLAHEAKIEKDGEIEIKDGRELWKDYKSLCKDTSLSFPERQIKLSELGEIMNCFAYDVSLEQAKAFHDEEFGYFYIEEGGLFIDEDGKFMREKYAKFTGGMFI